MNIRTFKQNSDDYRSMFYWWLDAKEVPPYPAMLSESSTFILEKDNKLLASLTVYLTNCKEIAYLENFIRDPKWNGLEKEEGIQYLLHYVENFAKELGYKKLICLAYKDKLKNRYQELGYKKTLDNLSSFCKEL